MTREWGASVFANRIGLTGACNVNIDEIHPWRANVRVVPLKGEDWIAWESPLAELVELDGLGTEAAFVELPLDPTKWSGIRFAVSATRPAALPRFRWAHGQASFRPLFEAAKRIIHTRFTPWLCPYGHCGMDFSKPLAAEKQLVSVARVTVYADGERIEGVEFEHWEPRR